MKKLIKPITIILFLILILIVINFTRNYIILKKIINKGNEILNSSNYHITIDSLFENVLSDSKNEIYFKDNICFIKTTKSADESVELYWKNYVTGESNSYYVHDSNIINSEFNEDLILSIKSTLSLHSANILKKSLFSIIPVKDDYYIIDNYRYYDKKSGTLIEEHFNSDNNDLNLIKKYNIELNSVKDSDILKPQV